MTSPTLRYALAPAFTWTSNGSGNDIAVTIGGTTYTGTVASGTYRVLLGTGATAGGSTEPLADFLQVVEAAASAAVAPETVAVTMGADGRVVVSCSAICTLTLTDAWRLLGFVATGTGETTYTATYAPKYLACFVGRTGEGRQVKTPGAWDTDGSGRSYGVTSGVTVRVEEMTFDLIPSDEAFRVALGCDQTAWEPAPGADLEALGSHAVPWTVADVLRVSGGKVVAFADANLQTLRASTASGARYLLGSLSPQDLVAPRAPMRDREWTAYRTLTVTFTTRSTTASATR